MSADFINIYKKNGVIEFDNIFDSNQIDKWNRVLEAHYAGSDDKVSLDLTDLGKEGLDILKEFFNDKIKYITNQLIKDPIVFYAGSNEIPSNATISHVNHNEIGGWHTDTGENLQYLDLRKPYWITFFVYLTDVGENDGPFEITNVTRKKDINNSTKSFSMTGKKGKCFLWGNPFYHRAAPNLGSTRRRILKIQVQHNYLQSSYNENLKKFHDLLNKEDVYFSYLTGKSHHAAYRDWNLDFKFKNENIEIIHREHNSKINLSLKRLIKQKIKNLFNVN